MWLANKIFLVLKATLSHIYFILGQLLLAWTLSRRSRLGYRKQQPTKIVPEDTNRKTTSSCSCTYWDFQTETTEYLKNTCLHNISQTKRNGSGFGIWGRFTDHRAHKSLGVARSLFSFKHRLKTYILYLSDKYIFIFF